jgi:hypothetical protein
MALRYGRRVAGEDSSYLAVIGDREPLAWILSEGRIAFQGRRAARSAGALQPGDKVYLYTTRGCFHNPTVDRGRVIGEATITSAAEPLDEPVVFGDREFTVGCTLDINALAPAREGVDLAEVVSSLHAFRVAERWSVYLRRSLVSLDEHDARLLSTRLRPLTTQPTKVLSGYQRLAAIKAAPRSRTA